MARLIVKVKTTAPRPQENDDTSTVVLMVGSTPQGDKGDKGDKWGDELITLVDNATNAANSAAYNANTTNAIAIGLVDNLTNQTIDFVNDAINNTAIEGGVLAATFVTVEEQITGEGALSLRDFNSRTILSVNSTAELLQVKATTGRAVFAKGLQGGTFVYDSSKSAINDGGLIFNGWVRDIRDKIITPEMFGAKPNDVAFDNTTALNAAFLTGFDVQSDSDSTYYVSGIINSKGQKCLGGWSIHSSRSDGSASGELGLVKTTTDGVDSLSVRMLYVESAYDLTELLSIKSLGFNTINHYGYFGADSNDEAGTVQQLLDNCLTAGLQVNLGTESSPANSNLAAFVAGTTDHPALWGYSVYDEPATREISVIDQDVKIASMRLMTTKPLSFVDLLVGNAAFDQKYSINYDTAFVDSYSMHYSTGTADDWLKKDLAKMRLDFGGIKAMTKISKVYPVISAFTANSFYSGNQAQIIRASTIFGKIAEGNFGAFVWDGKGDPTITDNVRKNMSYRKLCKDLCSIKRRKLVNTDVYIFGGTPYSTDWGLEDLLSNLITKDISSTADNVWSNAYPIRLNNGTIETDRISASVVGSFSGIGMKGAYSALPLNIKTNGNVRAVLEYFNVSNDAKSSNFQLLTTNDNGYTPALRLEDFAGVESRVLQISSTELNPLDTIILRIDTEGDTSTTYRKFLRGLIVCSDW